jgi:hypothetical protein
MSSGTDAKVPPQKDRVAPGPTPLKAETALFFERRFHDCF